ncbi:NUDIX hydrolase [Flavobacterium akiainvivens]|uniref:NUDIX hydrolase n=1 Tax=Flavobacterium akiainvivens TaxID=1202724 RepID=A0A0M8MGZ3_9FLAO|nr:NUDIX domain-containing protein [Flavobacterium akiainvivens]KOS05577.1 NUDIX hydrolase [Flavobacterium akiainvivens]
MFKSLVDKMLANSKVYSELYLSHISIDSVVFGFHDDCLKVLLTRFEGEDNWALPGGYVQHEENIYDAAKRILQQRTGATNIFLKQFETFGKTNRSEGFFEGLPDDLWQKKRFISIGYYALIDFTTLSPEIDMFSDACSWHDSADLPGFSMDHKEIYDAALLQLRRDLNYKPVGYTLLPEKFTMPQLQRLYEVILGKELNRGNFYRKMMRYNILQKLEETRKGGAHKAANYYSFDKQRYEEALNNGFQESW